MSSNYDSSTYGLLHCHTQHSLYDSNLTVKDFVGKAKDMGVKALAITDHGVCTGWTEFIDLCQKNGIQPIPGVEAYVNGESYSRAHFILLAKNEEGYKEISRAVTKANEKQENNGRFFVPVMDKEIISAYFGNGNVIATSACINGVLARILRQNEWAERDIKKIQKKLDKIGALDYDEYFELSSKVDHLQRRIEFSQNHKANLEKTANQKFAKREKGLKALREAARSEQDERECRQKESALEQDKQRAEAAKNSLADVKSTLASLRSELSAAKKQFAALSAKKDKIEDCQGQISEVKKRMLSDDEAYKAAEQELLWYKGVFGGDFYIEVQYHGMPEEARVMPILAGIAKQNGVPIVGTNDSHMAEQSDAEARAVIRSLRFERWEDPTESESACYMKTGLETYNTLCEILPKDAADEAMRNVKAICDQCSYHADKQYHYPRYRDENGQYPKDSGELLRRKAYDAIPEKYPDGLSEEGRRQLEEQLKVIIDLGYADYLLIVEDFISYGRRLGNNAPSGIGYSVGPGRGSGAGCIANYLLGITTVDPLEYGLIFERFLNPERVSMPDIDIDFSEEVREKVRDYVSRKYGEKSVAGISTQMIYKAKGALRAAARVCGFKEYPDPVHNEDDKAGRQKARDAGEALCKCIPTLPNAKLADYKEELTGACDEPIKRDILEKAGMLEGSLYGRGLHAAGFIIADEAPLTDYVPVLYARDKDMWAVQCDMTEAEGSLGLLKMDFLGLQNLDIITECIRRVKTQDNITVDPDHIPFEDEVFKNIYCEGHTDCVFQVESDGMKKMLRDLQPSSIDDIILAIAVYRPGPMDFIPDIISVKRGDKKPDYILPQLQEILAPTYGSPVYQEQIMDIFHTCAGFTLGEADIIRRYMSKKKEEEFLKYKPAFIDGFVKNGAGKNEAEEFWNSLVNFSRYAFNKSHAAVYAKLSYITAYLKYHFPGEYMSAVINHSASEKIPDILRECRRMGISVKGPDINRSNSRTEYWGGNLYYGLEQVKGVKTQADSIVARRRQKGTFTGLVDFLSKAGVPSDTASALIRAGAFDSIYPDRRAALLSVLSGTASLVRKASSQGQRAAAMAGQLKEPGLSKQEQQKLSEKRDRLLKALEDTKKKLKDLAIPPDVIDSPAQNLAAEKELLGCYISGHPLDDYDSVYNQPGIVKIQDCAPGYVRCAGLVSNLHTKRKQRGEMAWFDLEDRTGSIHVCAFYDCYEKYGEDIAEDAVILVEGKASYDTYNNEADPKIQIIADKISACERSLPPILVGVEDEADYADRVRAELMKYQEAGGYPVIACVNEPFRLINEDFRVGKAVLNADIDRVSIKILNYK